MVDVEVVMRGEATSRKVVKVCVLGFTTVHGHCWMYVCACFILKLHEHLFYAYCSSVSILFSTRALGSSGVNSRGSCLRSFALP